MKQYSPLNWTLFTPSPVIGIDEAGRGCLAGPVFSAAVILIKKDSYPDSKQVDPQTRNKLAEDIKKNHLWAVGVANVQEIESLNILQAVFLSMRRAVQKLGVNKGHILVDGPFTIPQTNKLFKQTALIKGDSRASPISAASIIAKTERDAWMRKQDKIYSHYGFSKHKGYATSQHRKAIAEKGPCLLHRKNFSGVKEYL